MRENGTSKFFISVDDSAISARLRSKTLLHPVREERRGSMLICNDNNGCIPDEFFTEVEDAALESERRGSLENQVDQLVYAIFIKPKDVSKKQTALSAISTILKRNFAYQDAEGAPALKSDILGAMSTRYADKHDKMGVFLTQVQGEEGKLPEDNPLKYYNIPKVHTIVFKGPHASVACRNFIESNYLQEDAVRKERVIGIVSDYNMPSYNGGQLISIIREAGYAKEQCYIVGVSAEQDGKESGDSVLPKFLEAGAQEAYIKDHFTNTAENIPRVRGAVYNMLGQNEQYLKTEDEIREALDSISRVGRVSTLPVAPAVEVEKPRGVPADVLSDESTIEVSCLPSAENTELYRNSPRAKPSPRVGESTARIVVINSPQREAETVISPRVENHDLKLQPPSSRVESATRENIPLKQGCCSIS